MRDPFRGNRSRCWLWWVGLGTSLCLFIGTPASGSEQLKRYEFLQIRMGIPVNITLYAPTELIANQASKAAFDRFRELDRVMSDYDPDSELMKLCKTAPPGEPRPVTSDLFQVLHASQRLSEETNGAFDVTVGPVVKLWRIARRRKKLPDEDRLLTALEKVGYQSIQLDTSNSTVTLLKPEMQIDLGSIAKGFAADEALKAMKELGVTQVLIDAGGDIVVGDPPPHRDYWRIEIEKLRRKETPNASAPIVKLNNAAIATSGSVYQHLEIDGIRYSHIVNPKTGIGLTTPSTVTVIAPNGMQADGLASAISVLGPTEGMKLICNAKNVEAFIVTSTADGKLTEVSTPKFESYLIAE